MSNIKVLLRKHLKQTLNYNHFNKHDPGCYAEYSLITN